MTTIDSRIDRVLTWFEAMGYSVLLQSDIVSGRHQAVLQNYRNGILSDRFCQAMQRVNPTATVQQIEVVLRQLTAKHSSPLLQQNRRFHLQLLEGIPAVLCPPEELPAFKLIDATQLRHNDWLVIYNFPAVEVDHQSCLDLVVFVNGLPLAVFQGLHAGREAWSLRVAYLQLQAYMMRLPKLFAFNELLVLSNGIQSQVGTLSTRWKQFVPIRSANQETLPPAGETEIKTLIQEVFDKRRLFEVIRHFIVFHQSRTSLIKALRPHAFCTVSPPKLA